MFRSQFSVYQRQVDLKEEDRIALLEQWKATGAKPEITSWWNAIFYVDAVLGNDNNDGSGSAPFRTIKKAVDSVPFSGRAIIKLLTEYEPTEEENIPVLGKKIIIDYSYPIKTDWVKMENIDYAKPKLTFEVGNGGTLEFVGNYASDAKIILLSNDTGFPEKADLNSFVKLSSDGSVNSVSFYFLNTKENYPPVEIYSGGLVKGYPESNMRSFGNVVFGEHYGKAGSDIVVDKANGAFLFDFHLGCGALTFLTNCVIKDTNGNDLSLADVVLGVVKDANGVPRNIVSNIVL